MSEEVLVFADLSDATVKIAKGLGKILGRPVPLQILTDSKCLFYIISKGSRTSEKRLILDIAAACEQFLVSDISDVGLVQIQDNLADFLTKITRQAVICICIYLGHYASILSSPSYAELASLFRARNFVRGFAFDTYFIDYHLLHCPSSLIISILDSYQRLLLPS